MHFENVNVFGEPLFRRTLQVSRGCLADKLQGRLIELRSTAKGLVHRQYIRLASKTADALDAPDKGGHVSCLGALEFRFGGSFGQEPRQFLINRFFDPLQVTFGPGGDNNPELSADLTGIDVGRYIRRRLLVIDQPLVEPRGFARGEHPADQLQVTRVRFTVRRNVPHFV